jgi:hypothetical protein
MRKGGLEKSRFVNLKGKPAFQNRFLRKKRRRSETFSGKNSHRDGLGSKDHHDQHVSCDYASNSDALRLQYTSAME